MGGFALEKYPQPFPFEDLVLFCSYKVSRKTCFRDKEKSELGDLGPAARDLVVRKERREELGK